MRSSSWRWLAFATTVGIGVLRPDALVGQPSSKLPSVGIIFAGSSTDPLQAIRKQTLRDTGYVEGQTIEVHWRFSEGRNERLPALARELVSRAATPPRDPAVPRSNIIGDEPILDEERSCRSMR